MQRNSALRAGRRNVRPTRCGRGSRSGRLCGDCTGRGRHGWSCRNRSGAGSRRRSRGSRNEWFSGNSAGCRWCGSRRSGLCNNDWWSGSGRRGGFRRGGSGPHARSFGGGILRDLFGDCGFFGGDFGVSELLEMFFYFFGGGDFNRAGVSLFFGDANFREIVEDRLSLDLEVAGQFVDANLIGVGHRARGSFLAGPRFGRVARLRGRFCRFCFLCDFRWRFGRRFL